MYTLEEVKAFAYGCKKCKLHKERTKVVFGQGNAHAEIMFIGEGPGQQEDQKGIAFIGPAGQLLTKAIEGINMTRDEVYIGNIVKCRPPNNRNPMDDEMEKCLPYLRWQVKLIRPKIMVCLGSVASKKIIDSNISITRERGKWHYKKGIWILPTYHPSAVLRDVLKKRFFWEDFKEIKMKYDAIKEDKK
ncbi:uracil-DNA glycosylase [Marinisporobacter balticus]|uniref:Type-4 uracil-DNA glycosylase n=1 Tax=Marinisporobacter balticus TaxID=2018667 RepID=A0A4R2KY98_9FIRM|nr:uracil-DNA glycosylase [Marinisporobacter balticus]TCO78082.1 DNA polymerase [Marinisporobacter balticus]